MKVSKTNLKLKSAKATRKSRITLINISVQAYVSDNPITSRQPKVVHRQNSKLLPKLTTTVKYRLPLGSIDGEMLPPHAHHKRGIGRETCDQIRSLEHVDP